MRKNVINNIRVRRYKSLPGMLASSGVTSVFGIMALSVVASMFGIWTFTGVASTLSSSH